MSEPKKTFSAGGVVLNINGEVLVVNQRGSSWSLPKGHLEGNEDEMAAARREIYEESGINSLELIKKLGAISRFKLNRQGVEDRTELKTITIFLFKTDQMDLNPVDKDNPLARWVNKDEVAGLLTHPEDKKFFLSILSEI
jgi:8-oxo-dGTP pyrophosphatase MutT (NUDIX family)